MRNEELIYKTKRPLWHLFLAFVLYFIGAAVLFKTCSLLLQKEGILGIKFLLASIFFLFCGVGISFSKKVYVNSCNEVIISFTLLNFKIVKDFIFKDISYIAIHSENNNKDFTLFFWFSDTNKKNIATFFKKNKALNFACLIADSINVKVLDATEKGNFKWIDNTGL